MHELKKTPTEELIARYIEHAESKRNYWDALIQHRESLTQADAEIPPILSSWPSRSAKRPSGRGRPPRWLFRDQTLIPEAIRQLEGCGLPVTSADGPCIAWAVADVFGLEERNVAAIWERAPNRPDKRPRRPVRRTAVLCMWSHEGAIVACESGRFSLCPLPLMSSVCVAVPCSLT